MQEPRSSLPQLLTEEALKTNNPSEVVLMLMQASRERPTSAHVIVMGNEKGGAGKSTIAMHVAVGLMNFGQRVATIDLDLR